MLTTLQRPKANNAVSNASLPQDCYLAWNFLSDLDRYYPDFRNWFFSKVCLDLAAGRRRILVKKSGEQVIAVAILKKCVEEKKICTFRVSKDAKSNGVGTELMLESLEWLQSSQPLVTVNEENAPEFERFLRKFHFQKTNMITGLYRPKKKEIIYNTPNFKIQQLNLDKIFSSDRKSSYVIPDQKAQQPENLYS
jgi:GNAT superfamily N-acetyltransferase